MWGNDFWSVGGSGSWGTINIGGGQPGYPGGYGYPYPSGYPVTYPAPYPSQAGLGLSGDTVMALVVIGIILFVALK